MAQPHFQLGHKGTNILYDISIQALLGSCHKLQFINSVLAVNIETQWILKTRTIVTVHPPS